MCAQHRCSAPLGCSTVYCMFSYFNINDNTVIVHLHSTSTNDCTVMSAITTLMYLITPETRLGEWVELCVYCTFHFEHVCSYRIYRKILTVNYKFIQCNIHIYSCTHLMHTATCQQSRNKRRPEFYSTYVFIVCDYPSCFSYVHSYFSHYYYSHYSWIYSESDETTSQVYQY